MQNYHIHILEFRIIYLYAHILSSCCFYGRENICHIVKAPAVVPWKVRELATEVAHKAVSSLEGAGVFAVELFLTETGEVIFFIDLISVLEDYSFKFINAVS